MFVIHDNALTAVVIFIDQSVNMVKAHQPPVVSMYWYANVYSRCAMNTTYYELPFDPSADCVNFAHSAQPDLLRPFNLVQRRAHEVSLLRSVSGNYL